MEPRCQTGLQTFDGYVILFHVPCEFQLPAAVQCKVLTCECHVLWNRQNGINCRYERRWALTEYWRPREQQGACEKDKTAARRFLADNRRGLKPHCLMTRLVYYHARHQPVLGKYVQQRRLDPGSDLT